MGAIAEVNSQTFPDQVLKSEVPVLVKFTGAG